MSSLFFPGMYNARELMAKEIKRQLSTRDLVDGQHDEENKAKKTPGSEKEPGKIEANADVTKGASLKTSTSLIKVTGRSLIYQSILQYSMIPCNCNTSGDTT